MHYSYPAIVDAFRSIVDAGIARDGNIRACLVDKTPDLARLDQIKPAERALIRDYVRFAEWQLNTSSIGKIEVAFQPVRVEMPMVPTLKHEVTSLWLSESYPNGPVRKVATWEKNLRPDGQLLIEPDFSFEWDFTKLDNRKKLAICYGAGMDSTIALYWAREQMGYLPKDIVLVQIDYGAPFSLKEHETTKKLESRLLRNCQSIVYVDYPVQDIVDGTMGLGYIIPSRNALLASIGAQFGENVWIVANYRKIDDGPNAASDKSRRFYNEISSLLSRMYGKPTNVWSPFLHMTKAETIIWFLKQSRQASDVDAPALEILADTTTCYDTTRQRCGTCFACVKLYKALCFVTESPAMKSDGFVIPQNFLFTENPIQAPDFLEFVQRELGKGREVPQSWIDRLKRTLMNMDGLTEKEAREQLLYGSINPDQNEPVP